LNGCGAKPNQAPPENAVHRCARIREVAFVAGLSFVLAASARAETIVVQMTTLNFRPTFVPSEITIRPGDSVRWVNVDPYLLDHSSCSGTGSADPQAGVLWNSGTVRTGESFEHVFPDAGDFTFFSIPHEFEGMFGIVHVTTSLDPDYDVQSTTWGRLKSQFAELLPRD
jgi:plastocyanin